MSLLFLFNRRAMKIQKRGGSVRGSACSPPPEEEGGEEGEYVPNSQLEPALLRKIQTNKGLSKLDQEVNYLVVISAG
jgi:hypothetical protein